MIVFLRWDNYGVYMDNGIRKMHENRNLYNVMFSSDKRLQYDIMHAEI